MKDFKIAKSLKKTIKNHKFDIKINENFKEVITRCKITHEKNHKATWISEDIINSYIRLHQKGYATSVEVYLDKVLVGGLYGVIVGKVFCGESMFNTVSNASKIAFYYLYQNLKQNKFDFIDCQVYSKLFESFGAKNIDRSSFLNKLKKSINNTTNIKTI